MFSDSEDEEEEVVQPGKLFIRGLNDSLVRKRDVCMSSAGYSEKKQDLFSGQ